MEQRDDRPVLRRLLDFPVEDVLGVLALLAAFAVMSVQVFLRYVLNDSLIWSEEAARYLLVAIAFLGCATGCRKACHIRIDAIDLLLPERARRALAWAVDAVVLDDLVCLRTGDQVPCDGVVLDCDGLEIDESLLDPKVYTDPKRSKQLTQERERLQQELEPLEFEWARRAE